MKRALKWVGIAVSMLCLGFFARQLIRQWSQISESFWTWQLGLGVLVAIFVYVSSYVSSTRSWQLALRILGAPRKFSDLMAISLTAQFAKYIPGNVGHHIGKVALASRLGIPTVVSVSSILIDTAMVATAAGIGALLSLKLVAAIAARTPYSLWLPVLVAAIAAALLVAVVSNRRARDVARDFLHSNPAMLSLRSVARMACGVALYLANFLLGALALFALAFAVTSQVTSVLTVMGVYSVAWLFGFMPGVPAGLGIREAILLTGLSPLWGTEAALVVTGVFRLVTIVGDGIAFGCGAWWQSRLMRSASSPPC